MRLQRYKGIILAIIFISSTYFWRSRDMDITDANFKNVLLNTVFTDFDGNG